MSENDVIIWSKNSFLTWSDFKAESNPAVFEDSHSVMKYQYTWTVNSEKMGKDILFLIENIQLSTEFQSLLSWVRPSETSDKLLKHEQGHFDLAELIKHENISDLQNKFYGRNFPTKGQNEDQIKQFAKEDSGKMIAMEVQRLEEILSKKRQEYNEQTNFGQNSEEQSKYDLVFDRLRL